MSGNGGTVGGSCWGFIVKEDMKTKYGQPKFKKGDILKPAGWNKPATNAPRGNVLDGMYEINWTEDYVPVLKGHDLYDVPLSNSQTQKSYRS